MKEGVKTSISGTEALLPDTGVLVLPCLAIEKSFWTIWSRTISTLSSFNVQFPLERCCEA